MKKERKINFEKLAIELGGFGKFQAFNYGCACLGSFYGGVMIIISVFASKVVDHRCSIPSCDDENSFYDMNFVNFTVPWNNATQQWDRCNYYTYLNLTENSCDATNFYDGKVNKCFQWVFDRTLFYSTTNMDFGLVCDKTWFIPLDMSSFMAGNLVGSITLGFIADRFGRKIGIMICAILFCGGGFIGANVNNYILFLFLRLVTGAGGIGFFQISFVSAIELMGPKWRTMCGILINIPFALGECFCILCAYFIREWRYLYMVAASPALLSFLYYWVLPESPRWLQTQGRYEEIGDIVEKAAKINKITKPSEVLLRCTEDDEYDDVRINKSLLDIYKSPVIRKRSFLLFYCWFVCSLVYYGLSTYSVNFSGNIFVNLTAMILVEIPGYIISAFSADKLGRKLTLISAFILSGVACMTASFLPFDYSALILTFSLIGKLSITAAFGAIFNYSGEIYPTEYRSIGVGTCSSSSRFGSIIAPFISNLAHIYRPLPSLVFGVASIIAGLIFFLLPETLGQPLPQSVQESEEL